jgi:hypothetical protein
MAPVKTLEAVSESETATSIRVALARVARAQTASQRARAERVAAMEAAYAAGATISAIAVAARVNTSVAWRTIRSRSNPAAVRTPV